MVVTFEFGHLLDPLGDEPAPPFSLRDLPRPHVATRVELPPPAGRSIQVQPVRPVPDVVAAPTTDALPRVMDEDMPEVVPPVSMPVSRFAAGGLDDDRLPSRRRRR